MYDPQSPDSEKKEIERESSYGRREYTTYAQIRKTVPIRRTIQQLLPRGIDQ